MELNDYYQILGLNYKFSSLELVTKYFKSVKVALNAGDTDSFIKICMGFEVLRNLDALESYERIYRKYILKQELNFPVQRENDWISYVQSRESLGKEIADEALINKESFSVYFTNYLTDFAIYDVFKIIRFWRRPSGIVLIFFGLFSILMHHNQINLFGGIILSIAGLLILRWNLYQFVITDKYKR